jgi:predicted MFS family arabinose efflux permease
MTGIFFATFMGAKFGWRSPWMFMLIPTLLAAWYFWKFIPNVKREDTPAYAESLQAGGKQKGVFKDVLKVRNAWIIFSSPWCKSGFVSRKFCGIHRLCL